MTEFCSDDPPDPSGCQSDDAWLDWMIADDEPAPEAGDFPFEIPTDFDAD